MDTSTPMEADWHQAPDLMEGAMNLRLTPDLCDLDYWINHAAQGTWRELEPRWGHLAG